MKPAIDLKPQKSSVAKFNFVFHFAEEIPHMAPHQTTLYWYDSLEWNIDSNIIRAHKLKYINININHNTEKSS